jgi:uncharacterized membrane protein YphA (DoxX/SURF4 family)
MKKEQVLGLVRHALTFVGGIMVANGVFTESISVDLVGAIMTLVGIVWSAVSNK